MVLKPLDFLLVATLSAISLLVGGFLLLPNVCGVSHDDAIYIITAKAIAMGKGYCLINLPGEPLQTKYPILYPAILSLFWRVFPDFPQNLIPMKWLSIVFGTLAIGLGYLYLVRWKYVQRPMAYCGALLCTVSSWYWYCATLTQTEAPFAALLIYALWCLEKQIRQTTEKSLGEVLTGIALALPFLCRVLGATLIPVALWLLFKSGRRLKFTVLGMALVAAPWIFCMLLSYGTVKSNPMQGYYTDYLGWWNQSAPYLLSIFFFNFCVILLQSSILIFSGLHMWCMTTLGNGYLIASALLGLIPWWYLWKSKTQQPVLPLFMACYLLLILVWPWPPGRFLVPLLPLMSGLSLAGLHVLIQKLVKNKAQVWLYAAIVVVAFSANIYDIGQKTILDKQHGYPSVPFDRQLTVDWSSYQNLFSWLREHNSHDAILASEFDSMVSLYTGSKCIRPCPVKPIPLHYLGTEPPLGTVDELLHILSYYQVEYLVAMPLPGSAEELPFANLLEAVKKEHPQFLETVYTGHDIRFVIYKCHYAG